MSSLGILSGCSTADAELSRRGRPNNAQANLTNLQPVQYCSHSNHTVSQRRLQSILHFSRLLRSREAAHNSEKRFPTADSDNLKSRVSTSGVFAISEKSSEKFCVARFTLTHWRQLTSSFVDSHHTHSFIFQEELDPLATIIPKVPSINTNNNSPSTRTQTITKTYHHEELPSH